jgi:hypothetical protein
MGEAHWSQREVDIVLEEYGRCTRRNFHLASDAIMARLGPWATPGAVRAMLLRRKLNPASQWCSDGAGAIAARGSDRELPSIFEDEDEVTNVYDWAKPKPLVEFGPDGSRWERTGFLEHAWRGDVEPPKDTDRPVAPNHSNVVRVAILPDCHIPDHDPVALPLALKAIRKFAPDVLVVLDDFCDFSSLSSHGKRPDIAEHLKSEISAGNYWLDKIDSIPVKRKMWTLSNHSSRLERRIAEKCPEFHGMFDIPSLLRLAERGYEVSPYKSFAQIGKLLLAHDVGFCGLTAAAKSRDDTNSSIVVGHCHSANVQYRSNVHGDVLVGVSSGWLGNSASIGYAYRHAVARSWVHGFSIAYVEQDTGNAHVHFVPIINGRCVVEGVVVEADN